MTLPPDNRMILHMGATTSYISKARVKELAQRSDLWGAWLTFHVWFVVIAAMSVFIIWPNVVTFILAFWVLGYYQA